MTEAHNVETTERERGERDELYPNLCAVACGVPLYWVPGSVLEECFQLRGHRLFFQGCLFRSWVGEGRGTAAGTSPEARYAHEVLGSACRLAHKNARTQVEWARCCIGALTVAGMTVLNDEEEAIRSGAIFWLSPDREEPERIAIPSPDRIGNDPSPMSAEEASRFWIEWMTGRLRRGHVVFFGRYTITVPFGHQLTKTKEIMCRLAAGDVPAWEEVEGTPFVHDAVREDWLRVNLRRR